MLLVHACWAAYKQLLHAEGLTEACLRQTWQALTYNIKESLKSGRGYKIPGLCTILPGVSAAPAAVLLSDQLLTAAPHLQPGKGCIHHASVKQQTQRVDTLNVAKLVHGFARGLSQDAVKLALKLLVSTVSKQLSARQGCTVDLAVGQLRFAAGGAVAEFTANPNRQTSSLHGCSQESSTCESAPAAAPAGPATSNAQQGQHSSAGSCCSHMSKHSRAAKGLQPNCADNKAPIWTGTAAAASVALPAIAASSSLAMAVPDKPSNCTYDPVAAWEIAREVRTAAEQNARVKAAAFVLPAGGPGDDGAGEPKVPQGKGRHPDGTSFGQRQALEAAAVRTQQEAAARAVEEAMCLSLQAARISALNQQAQQHQQQKRAQTRQLAADLTQQMHIKALRAAGKHSVVNEQALLVSKKPDAAAVRACQLQQQAKYRACLDAQRAGQGSRMQQQPHADQSELQELRDHQRQMMQAALGERGLA